MALLSDRAQEQALSQLAKARELMAKSKEKGKLLAEQAMSAGLVVGGGALGGALDGYFPEQDKQVLGLKPSETLAVAGIVLAFSGVMGKHSEYVKHIASGTAAYALGDRARVKAAQLKAQKQDGSTKGYGASAAQVAARLEAERRARGF